MPKAERGPSSLHPVQKVCKTHSLAIPSEVQSVQDVIEDALAALVSGEIIKTF